MRAFARYLATLTLAGTIALLALTSACGGSPVAPPPPPPPPPANNAPVITSIKIQGSRANEPPGFADLSESVNATVEVRDDETPVSQLQITWSSTVGTFSGSGAAVTWQAPSQATTPVDVTLALEVIERYGPPTAPAAFEHRVSGSASLRLHDSAKEVGDMARQFLLDFSDSTIRDVDYIMRNFSRKRCPQPSEVDNEYSDVTRDRAERRRTDFTIGSVPATVNFGGVCPIRFRRGDACVVVPVSGRTSICRRILPAPRAEATSSPRPTPQTRRAGGCAPVIMKA